MTKSALLLRLEQLRHTAEDDAIQPVYKLAVIDSLLDYIGDFAIRQKTEEIAL